MKKKPQLKIANQNINPDNSPSISNNSSLKQHRNEALNQLNLLSQQTITSQTNILSQIDKFQDKISTLTKQRDYYQRRAEYLRSKRQAMESKCDAMKDECQIYLPLIEKLMEQAGKESRMENQGMKEIWRWFKETVRQYQCIKEPVRKWKQAYESLQKQQQ